MKFLKEHFWKIIIFLAIFLLIIFLFLLFKPFQKDIEEVLPFPVIQTETNTDISLKDGGWKPINPYSVKKNNKIRIYPSPKWIRPDGKNWMPIEDVVSIKRDNNKWTISIGDSWVSLKVREGTENIERFLSSIKYSINDGKRFGPVLDASLAPDEIEWLVEASSQAIRKDNGDIVLKEYDGIELGLFFDDWRAMFGEKLEIKKGAVNNFNNEIVSIKMNLTDVKKIAMTENKEINLDPTIFSDTESGTLQTYSNESWSAAREAIPTVLQPGCYAWVYGSLYENNIYNIYRCFLRFNITEISNVRSIKLYFYTANPQNDGGSGDIAFYKINDYGTLTSDDFYKYETGNLVGTKLIEDYYGGNFDYIDVTNYINNGEYNAFTILNYNKDALNLEPINENYGISIENPYLEIELLQPPEINIYSASSITTTTARLNGTIANIGIENPTVTIYWGKTDGGQTESNWEFSSAPTEPPQPQEATSFYLDVSNLEPGTTYWFSASAFNSDGTVWPDSSLSFTTLCQTDDDCEVGYSCVENVCIVETSGDGEDAVNGSCGTANRTYNYNETSFGQDTFCLTGTVSPESPSFPSPGHSVSWICLGSGGGSNSDTCTAHVRASSIGWIPKNQPTKTVPVDKSVVISRNPSAINTVNTIVNTVKSFVQQISYSPQTTPNKDAFIQIFQNLLIKLKDLLTLTEQI